MEGWDNRHIGYWLNEKFKFINFEFDNFPLDGKVQKWNQRLGLRMVKLRYWRKGRSLFETFSQLGISLIKEDKAISFQRSAGSFDNLSFDY